MSLWTDLLHLLQELACVELNYRVRPDYLLDNKSCRSSFLVTNTAGLDNCGDSRTELIHVVAGHAGDADTA